VDSSQTFAAIASWAKRIPLIKAVHIFGSRAQGNHRPDSDLDVAIELDTTAIHGSDESGGVATWMFESGKWPGELAALVGLDVDLQQLIDETTTPVIATAVKTHGWQIYAKT